MVLAYRDKAVIDVFVPSGLGVKLSFNDYDLVLHK
jgi:hypothetical protein